MINTKDGLRLTTQGGFSLIELMIAILIGLLVTLAALQIFTSSLQGIHLQNAYARVQENGRMATELLTRDVRSADYWGCMSDTSLITNHLDTTTTEYIAMSASLPTTGTKGVAGENDVTSRSFLTISVKDNTDILTLRGTQTLSGVKVETPYMTPNSATIHIKTGSDIAKGTILLISDCVSADLFANTAQNTSGSGNIIHNKGNLGTGLVDNITKPLSHTYDASAQILIPFTKIYFIGKAASATGYSLYRSDSVNVQELVRGVKDLQLLYGEDKTGDGSADTFADASAVNMDNVRSIRISLVSESGGSSSGTPLEKTYTVTANIRNRTLK